MIDQELEYQYNARAAVPEHGKIFSRWQERSQAFREISDCRLDQPYGNGERQKLDLFPGAGERLHLFLHGGYWQGMDKSFFSFVAEGLVAAGVDVAVCNYPLCPQASLVEILESVRQACRFLWFNASRFGARWKSLQLSGHSAGGQLVAMLMTTHWPEWDRGLPADLIDSGIALSGLYDLQPLLRTSINEKLGLDEPMARSQSPLYLPAATGAPMLLVAGGEERPAFREQMRSFGEHRRLAGLPVETLCLEGLNHFTLVEELANRKSTLLQRVLAMR